MVHKSVRPSKVV